MNIHKTFEDVSINEPFVDDRGNHNVIYRRIKLIHDKYNNPCNAVIVKSGKKHYEYFRNHEGVKTH